MFTSAEKPNVHGCETNSHTKRMPCQTWMPGEKFSFAFITTLCKNPCQGCLSQPQSDTGWPFDDTHLGRCCLQSQLWLSWDRAGKSGFPLQTSSWWHLGRLSSSSLSRSLRYKVPGDKNYNTSALCTTDAPLSATQKVMRSSSRLPLETRITTFLWITWYTSVPIAGDGHSSVLPLKDLFK